MNCDVCGNRRESARKCCRSEFKRLRRHAQNQSRRIEELEDEVDREKRDRMVLRLQVDDLVSQLPPL